MTTSQYGPKTRPEAALPPPFDLSAAAALLRRKERALITAHANPDGDAWGSMCALAHICLALGLEARLSLTAPPPDFLSWLVSPVPLCFSHAELGGWQPDLAVFLDCGGPERCGPDNAALAAGRLPPGWAGVDILNLDHHGDNPYFGLVNVVEEGAGATAELAGLLAEALGLPLEGELGEAVYLGLTADTGNFTYAGATASVMDMAARIVRSGLKVEEFTARSENNWSMGKLRLWGELLQRLKFSASGRVVSLAVEQETLARHGCKAADLEGLASFIRRLRTAQVSLLVREKAGGSKVSLRAKGGAGSPDLRRVAALFGGGGHVSAAGAALPLRPEEAEKAVLAALLPVLGEFAAGDAGLS